MDVSNSCIEVRTCAYHVSCGKSAERGYAAKKQYYKSLTEKLKCLQLNELQFVKIRYDKICSI